MRLFFFAISILAFIGCSCGHNLPKTNIGSGVSYDAAIYNTPLDKREFQSVIAMIVTCPEGNYYGSGSIIDTHVILTARHMIKCNNGAGPEVSSILIKLPDGTRITGTPLAYAEGVGSNNDIGLIMTDDEDVLPVSTGISFRQPFIGEKVCDITGLNGVRKCGDVSRIIEETFYVGMRSIPGDSGSPIFDAEGNIMGVISALIIGNEYITVGIGNYGSKEMIQNRNKLIAAKKITKAGLSILSRLF
jgi:V8-like Glu-specific endopeptidase